MRVRTALFAGFVSLIGLGMVFAQNPFREWPAIEYGDFPLPSDYKQPAEWTRGRLRYPDNFGYPGRAANFGGRAFPGYWTMDYPRSDRHMLEGVRRLTRINARSVEQVVSLDGTDDIYNFPFVYGVEVGHWVLPDDQAGQLRDFLERGGFIMFDDFHGEQEWRAFLVSLKRVFPNRQVVDIPDGDPIFHALYDVDTSVQIPGAQYIQSGLTYERTDGKEPHWRAVYDDKGRIIAAMCHNMDLGDAVEWSDAPEYPEKFASTAFRVVMNYFVYDLTH
jgi:hypothetical protein